MLQEWVLKITMASFLLTGGTTHAFAQDFWSDTFLLDVYMGSYRASVASNLRRGGYELSGGNVVDFRDWYTPQVPDTTFLFLKQISPEFGVIWGISTGEKGKKYRIEPALQLGIVYQYIPFRNAVISVKATYPFFGKMTEQTCIADYGNLGGVQIVNCRLAADIIPPEETLDYLIKLEGKSDAKISVSFSFVF